MKEFSNTDDILDFAIDREQDAVDFYRELAAKSKNTHIRETFERFAMEEVGHKTKLMKIKEEKTFVISNEVIQDLKISDYIDNVRATEGLSYQDALILAMKREKSAFKLYTNLAAKTNNKALQALFSQLAIEESKHKLMFELEYDEVILNEN
jgi:rubrerythrin